MAGCNKNTGQNQVFPFYFCARVFEKLENLKNLNVLEIFKHLKNLNFSTFSRHFYKFLEKFENSMKFEGPYF